MGGTGNTSRCIVHELKNFHRAKYVYGSRIIVLCTRNNKKPLSVPGAARSSTLMAAGRRAAQRKPANMCL